MRLLTLTIVHEETTKCTAILKNLDQDTVAPRNVADRHLSILVFRVVTS